MQQQHRAKSLLLGSVAFGLARGKAKRLLVSIWVAGLAFSASACGLFAALNPLAPKNEVVLRLHGSNTIGAKLAPELVKAFLQSKGATNIHPVAGDNPEESFIEATLPGVDKPQRIAITAHGSDYAFTDLAEGKCDVGMASRKIKLEEASKLSNLGDMETRGSENVIALDGLAIIVNRSNSIKELSIKQISDIFTGTIKDWSELKGSSGAIKIYARDEKSGTFDTFKNLVLGKNKKLAGDAKLFEDSKKLSEEVAADPDGIGFVGLPYIGQTYAVAVSDEGVKPLKPNAITVQTQEYLLHRKLYFYLPPNTKNELAREFVEFARSNAGQEIASNIGFVGANMKPVVTNDTEQASAQDTGLPPEYVKIRNSAREFPTRFYFRPNSSNLDNKSLDDFDRIVAYLAKEGRSSIILVGFADSNGQEERNRKISQDRAATVEKEFVQAGIKPVQVLGLGSAAPKFPNTTAEGREKNRRVEIWQQ